MSSGTRGLVRLGFTAASTFGILGPLLNEVARELPEVHLDLAEMVSTELVVIDGDTTPRRLANELRWNQAYYRLARGF